MLRVEKIEYEFSVVIQCKFQKITLGILEGDRRGGEANAKVIPLLFPGKVGYELNGFPGGAFFFVGVFSGLEVDVLNFYKQLQRRYFLSCKSRKILKLHPLSFFWVVSSVG